VRAVRVAKASAVVPLSPEETWDLLLGDKVQRLVEMPDMSVVAVEGYQMRPDGTPRYMMANRVGPTAVSHTADFTVYERPRRSVNRVLDSPLRGHALWHLRTRDRGHPGELALGGRAAEPAG